MESSRRRRRRRDERTKETTVVIEEKTSNGSVVTTGTKNRTRKEKDSSEKNKENAPTASSNKHSVGRNNLLDRISRFESGADSRGKKESTVDGLPPKSPFRRATGGNRTNNEPLSFRRSYRVQRSNAIEETGAHLRRSLRGREKVKDSIAKLESKATKPITKTSTRESIKTSSLTRSATSDAPDGSSVSSVQRRLARAEQALERHKDRMRKTPVKSAPGKFSPDSAASVRASPSRKNTASPSPSVGNKDHSKSKTNDTKASGDNKEVVVSAVTEITTPSKEKIELVVKERTVSLEKEEPEPTPNTEARPNNLPVGVAVELFEEAIKSPINEKPKEKSRQSSDDLSPQSQVAKTPTDEITEEKSINRKNSTDQVPKTPTEEIAKEKIKSPKNSADQGTQAEVAKTPTEEIAKEKTKSRKSSADQGTQAEVSKTPIDELTKEKVRSRKSSADQGIQVEVVKTPTEEKTKKARSRQNSHDQITQIQADKTLTEEEVVKVKTRRSRRRSANKGAQIQEPETTREINSTMVKNNEDTEDQKDVLQRIRESKRINQRRPETLPTVDTNTPKTSAENHSDLKRSQSNPPLTGKVNAETTIRKTVSQSSAEGIVLPRKHSPIKLDKFDDLLLPIVKEKTPAHTAPNAICDESIDSSYRQLELLVNSLGQVDNTRDNKEQPEEVFELKAAESEEEVVTTAETPEVVILELGQQFQSVDNSGGSDSVAEKPVPYDIHIVDLEHEKSATVSESFDLIKDSTIKKPQEETIKRPTSPDKLPKKKSSERRRRKRSSTSSKSENSENKKERTEIKEPEKIEIKSAPVEKSAEVTPPSKKTRPKSPIKRLTMTDIRRRAAINRRRMREMTKSESDDDSSQLSEANSDDEKISDSWLFDGDSATDEEDLFTTKKKSSLVSKSPFLSKKQQTTPKKESVTPRSYPIAEKSEKTKVIVSPPDETVDVNVGSVKSAWEKKLASEKKVKTSGDFAKEISGDSEDGSTPVKVNSMLSMWEKKTTEVDIKDTHKTIELDGLRPKVQGAKSMFENLATSPGNSLPTTPSRSPRPVSKTIRQLQNGYSSSSSSDESDGDSHEKTKNKRHVKSTLSDMVDCAECDVVNVRNVKAMWESHYCNQSPQEEKVSYKKAKQTPPPKSSKQAKILRRKKGRRSMTQPVTNDDVNSARNLVVENGNTSDNQVDDEPILSVSERLKFFNQIKQKTEQESFKKERVAPARKRFGTLPVNWQDVVQAENNLSESSSTKTEEKVASTTKETDSPKLNKNPEDIEMKENNDNCEDVVSMETEVDEKLKEEKTLDVETSKIVMSEVDGKFPKRKRETSVSSQTSSFTDATLSSTSSEDEDDKGSKPPKGDNIAPRKWKVSDRSWQLSDTESTISLSSRSSVTSPTPETKIPLQERLKAIQNKLSSSKSEPLSQPKKVQVVGSLGDRMKKLSANQEKWRTNSHQDLPEKTSVGKIKERVASIKRDSETWKSRSGQQNDATQFTVQAKIAKKEGLGLIKVLPSPIPIRRTKPQVQAQDVVTAKETKIVHSESMKKLAFVEQLASKGLEENVIKKSETSTTIVPQIDSEEFESFFTGSETAENHEPVENGIATEEDFELPDIQTTTKLSDIGRMKSVVRPASKKRKGSGKNPLKVLAARENLKDSYEEERTNVSRLEQQRLASRGYGANFTAAALAGLAAKEDLRKLGNKLKSTKTTPMPSSDDLRPFKDIMLLRVKGRTHVQTRLVEPVSSSLCSDDAFLLVTGDKLFAWYGEFCNVLERAKVDEMANYIVINKDLGSRVSSYAKIEEGSSARLNKDFWELLGGKNEWNTEVSPDGDEVFETVAQSSIKSYKMMNSKLEPFKEAWGKHPEMKMLKSSDIYVFDFGSEMYVWQGKDVSFANRQMGVRLAKVLWDKGFDYTELGASPFHINELKGPRPSWGLFARVNENLETCVVQEKFPDWSNIHREIGEREAQLRETNRGTALNENKVRSEISTDLKPCDVTSLLTNETIPSPLTVSGYNIRDGEGQIRDEDDRIMEVITCDSKVFHISDKEANETEDFILHRGDTYIVRWRYVVSSTGKFVKTEKRNSVSSDANGRTRVCYFVWVGEDSSINDKGASALMATNLDLGEEGSHIVVSEHSPPPAFSRIFGGCCAIMDGTRQGKNSPWEWKLFAVRGNSEEDVTLVQVQGNCKSLRSRGSFVIIQARKAQAIIWHGCRSTDNTKKMAESAVKKLSERMPAIFGFRKSFTEIDMMTCVEGEEPELFWEAIGLKRRDRYMSLLNSDQSDEVKLRAFHFKVKSDEFIAEELCPVENDTGLPIEQNQLYELDQPSVVLVHSPLGVHLWQGWQEDNASSSRKRLWDVMRRLSMETTLNYCKEHGVESDPLMMYAGHESMEFMNLFPSWKEWKSVNKVELKVARKVKLVSEALSKLSRLTYTIEELRSETLPDGVDPRHLETYLSTKDFEKLFSMAREDFYKLPAWKQSQLRKKNNFF